ncbi:MAG: hypothetical protein ACX94B_02745 [Henriciella sp.]|nr:hypothetical protein [Hyphomonadaceae bacterium]
MSDPITVKMNQPFIGERTADHAIDQDDRNRKWPVWVRVLIILSISAGLWTLIIAGIRFLLS